jgi:hypothetical protein
MLLASGRNWMRIVSDDTERLGSSGGLSMPAVREEGIHVLALTGF